MSHSHVDKRVTRSLARELRAYGFRVWIDEAELQLGTVLSPSLQAHIDDVDVLVVVASAASARSTWVALEVAHAVKHGKRIVPFYTAPAMTAEVFRDHLGIDATSPTGFVDAAHRLMTGLMPADFSSLPEPDLATLEADLRAVAKEEPDLRPLIDECLDRDEKKMPQSALDDPDFYALDYALHAIFELKQSEYVAHLAAHAFRRRGAGVAALSRWTVVSGDGGLPLVMAVGDRLEPGLLNAAIELLRGCSPTNNQAMYSFIDRNSGQLNEAQRRATLSLVVWPERGPERMGDILGSVALKRFPGSPEVLQMWRRWINDGHFDSAPCGPSDLAQSLALAERDEVPGLDTLCDALRSHVRRYLRSGDERKIYTAVDHLRANADEETGALAALCAEASGVSGTAEWEDWAARDPEKAAEMAIYVFVHKSHAESDKNWLKALEDYDRSVEFEKLRRRAREGRT